MVPWTVLVCITTCCRTSYKPWFVSVTAQFTDACMCDMASVCWSVSFLCFSRVYVYLDTFLISRFLGPIWGRQDPGGPHVVPMNFAIWNMTTQEFPIIIPPASTKLKGVYTGFTLSRVCPSVDRIVSALYLQQYSSDLFNICTSYQATSGDMSRVMLFFKFKIFGEFLKFVTLTLSSFDLGSNMTQ